MPSSMVMLQLILLTTAHATLMVSAAIVISVQSTTVKARMFVGGEPVGKVAEAVYEVGPATAPAVTMLKPLATPTTLAQALAVLPKSDIQRGEELFFDRGGAGCFNYHRVGSQGNN